MKNRNVMCWVITFILLSASIALAATASLQTLDGIAVSSGNPLPVTLVGGGGGGTECSSAACALNADTTVQSGANPTVSAAGEVGVDTSATSGSAFRFYGDAAYTLPAYQSKSIILDTPTSASDYEMGSLPANITIRAIRVLAVGGTNVVGGLQETDANGLNPVAVDADITATAATTATDDGSLTNATVDANDQLQWLTTSVSGSVTRAVVTVYFTYDSVN